MKTKRAPDLSPRAQRALVAPSVARDLHFTVLVSRAFLPAVGLRVARCAVRRSDTASRNARSLATAVRATPAASRRPRLASRTPYASRRTTQLTVGLSDCRTVRPPHRRVYTGIPAATTPSTASVRHRRRVDDRVPEQEAGREDEQHRHHRIERRAEGRIVVRPLAQHEDRRDASA